MVFAAALCTSMIHSTAMAAPLDELNEIMERQQSLKTESLLAETLGISELGKAIAENGIDISLTGGLSEGTASLLNLDDTIFSDPYISLGFKLDTKLQKWLLEAGFGNDGISMGDAALYGDTEKLSLAVPQIFDGIVSLYSGNLKEQYEGSALEQMIGAETSAALPDINLKFYPDASDSYMLQMIVDVLEEGLNAEAEELKNQMQVEKEEAADGIVYTVSCNIEDIMDLYREVIEAYMQMIALTGAIESDVLELYEDTYDETLDQLHEIIQDDIEIKFHVQDGLIEKIDYELYMDTSAILAAAEAEEGSFSAGEAENSQDASEELEGIDMAGTEEAAAGEGEVLEEAGVLKEAVTAADAQTTEEEGFKGYICYEWIYNESGNPYSSADFIVSVEDEKRNPVTEVRMQLRSEKEEQAAETTVGLDVTVNEELLYSGTIYRQAFDAVTGDFDLEVSFDNGMDEYVALKLDSNFADIEAGNAFTWNLDSLTLEAEGEAIGVTGQLKVSAQPGTIDLPQQERELLALDEEGLTRLLYEAVLNAQNWAAQFETETAEDTQSVAVIGSADGPTSIFLAGKVS